MAIRNIIVRGYGPGATIPFVVLRGYTSALDVSATISGTVAFTETTVRAGGQTIIITINNDTWVAAGTPFNQQRQNILNGISSAQAEITGWNREVRDKESIVSVVRTSDTVVTVTLSAAPGYDITVAEVITVTVPDEALETNTDDVIGIPTIGVTADIPILENHTLSFSSVSNLMTFSAIQQQTTFQSASNIITITDTPLPLGFILTEDGAIIEQESGSLFVAKE